MAFSTPTRCSSCQKLSVSNFETIEHDNGYVEIPDREWRCSCGHLNNFEYRTAIVPYHPLDDLRNGRGVINTKQLGTNGDPIEEPAEGGHRTQSTIDRAQSIVGDKQARLDAMKADSPGGEHYRAKGAVQPIDLIESFDLPYREGSIIDHVARWRTHPQGLLNLKKALWMLQRIIVSNE